MKTTFTITAKELLGVQAKIKYLRAKEKEVATRLREICENETKSINGYTYKQFERKGPVIYTNIPELKDVDLDKYRSDAIIAWRLSYQEQFEDI